MPEDSPTVLTKNVVQHWYDSKEVPQNNTTIRLLLRDWLQMYRMLQHTEHPGKTIFDNPDRCVCGSGVDCPIHLVPITT